MKNPAPKQTAPLLLTCLSFAWFCSIVSYAQVNPLNIERLSTENGLSSNVVYSIIQDSRGYLWIGTNVGLNRYDGYGFKTFRHIPGDTASLTANAVNSVCEDDQGNIWAATQGGLCRLNVAKNNFTRIQFQKKDSSPVTKQIIRVNKDELMIMAASGIWLLNTHTLSKIAIRGKNIPPAITHPLSKDKKGNIYLVAYDQDSITTTNTVLIYDAKQKSFTKLLKFQPERQPRREELSHFYIDSRNAAWIGTSDPGRLFFYEQGAGVNMYLNSSILNTTQMVVNKVFEDKDGNIWISSAKGVYFYDRLTGSISNKLLHSSGKNTTIAATAISQDRTGVIWIGSFNGIYKINPSNRQFRSLTEIPGSKTPLLNNFVLGIRSTTINKILIEYYWGIPEFSLLDIPHQTIAHYLKRDYNFTDYLEKIILRNPEHFNEESFRRSLPLLQEHKKQLENQYASSLLFDSKNHVWLVMNQSLRKLMPGGTRVYYDVTDAQLQGDEIWMAGTAKGLRSVHTPSMKLTEYLNDPREKNSINSNNLNCLLIEQNGNIWIGTQGVGLDYFDRKKNIFQHYNTDNGLCNNSIFSMVKDDRGRLWLGTGNGLSCFDITTNIFTNFSHSDGLVNAEFNRYSACKLSDGYILMGGMDGIDYFHPDSLLNNDIKPQVQITDFRIFNKSVFPLSDLSLAHNQNYVTIDFAAMDFRNTSLNKFAYKLQGIDKDWIIAGNLHSVSYPTLAPGSYHFLVKAAGSDGVWNDTPAEITFSISSPWWKTGWFYSSCVLFIAAILFWFYQYRIRHLKKIMQLRTKISQDLHDDVGATLSGIRVFSQLAKERPAHNSEYLDKITHYSDDMLNKLSDIVWSINTEYDSFEQQVSKLRNYAQAMTTAKNICLEFYFDPEIEKKELNITLRRNIYMITREAINNAVKYAGCSTIRVSLKAKPAGAELLVEDNGKGIDKENINAGNGLSNMRKRAEQLQGLFSIETAPAKGTSIRVLFKFT